MTRGKGTPRRTRELADDDDFSPTSSSPRRAASPPAASPSRLAMNATANPTAPEKSGRGPLPASAETTYHQRLRGLLVEHRKARRAWSELVIRGLVGRTKAVLELWVDVELALKAISKQSPTASTTNVRAGYLFAQSAKLSEQVATVEGVFTNLTETVNGMHSICERAEHLVIEAAKTRGTLFAFREPMWVTWPLARFTDGIQALTTPYVHSLALVRQLLDTLLTFPVLPSASASSPSPDLLSATVAAKSEKDDRLRPSNEQIQASLSLLAVQPLLPGKANDWGSEGWEEVMAVEVGGWER